ncbi:hypothetical protein HDU93_002163, partial [Gonapodya sp. JEL0774]
MFATIPNSTQVTRSIASLWRLPCPRVSIGSRFLSNQSPDNEPQDPASVVAEPLFESLEDIRQSNVIDSLPIINPTRLFLAGHPPAVSMDTRISYTSSPAGSTERGQSDTRGRRTKSLDTDSEVPIIDTHAHLAEVFYRKRLPVSEVA